MFATFWFATFDLPYSICHIWFSIFWFQSLRCSRACHTGQDHCGYIQLQNWSPGWEWIVSTSISCIARSYLQDGNGIYLRLHLLEENHRSVDKNLGLLRMAEHQPFSKHQRACGQLWPHWPGFHFHVNLEVCFHSHFHFYCYTRIIFYWNVSTFT